MRKGAALRIALALCLLATPTFADTLAKLAAKFEREKGAPYQTRQQTVQQIADLKTEAAARFLIKVVDEDADRTMQLNTIYRVAQIPLPIAWRALLRFFENPDLQSSAFSGMVSYRQEDLPDRVIEAVRASQDQGLRSNLIRYFGGYPSGDGDHSNTQYAVLGLRSAARVGIRIPKQVWKRILTHFYDSRNPDGGWDYVPTSASDVSSSSMTSAGVTCLLICLENAELTEEERNHLLAVIDGGFTALGEKMKIDKDSLYALYGIERAGVLGSRALMGDQPWYVPGAKRLIEEQGRDGHWRPGYHEAVDTSFAILFLKKATAPISSR